MGRGRLIMAWLSSCLANHNLPKNAPCACLKFLSTPGGSRGSRVRLASNPARREPGPSRPRSALRFPTLALRCSCPGVGPRARGLFPPRYLLSDPDFEDFESTASGEPSKPGEDSSGPDMDDEGVVRPPRRAKSHFQQLANEQRREQSRVQQVSSSWSKDERTSCGVLFTQIRW